MNKKPTLFAFFSADGLQKLENKLNDFSQKNLGMVVIGMTTQAIFDKDAGNTIHLAYLIYKLY